MPNKNDNIVQCDACGSYIDIVNDSHLFMRVENKARDDYGEMKYFCGTRDCEMPDVSQYRRQDG